jgi:hypothetical protein
MKISKCWIIILLALTCNIWAESYWFSGAAGDNQWTTSSNWWINNGTYPESDDFVSMSDAPRYCKIIEGLVAEANELYVGHWAQDPQGTATLDVNNSTLLVGGDTYIGVLATMWGADGANQAVGDMNIYNNSAVTIGKNLYIGREGIGILNMRSGTLNIAGDIWCPGGPMPEYAGQEYTKGIGRLNLHGGTITASDLKIYETDTTEINIMGGTLILNGNQYSKILSLCQQGKIFAYSGRGELIFDYSARNAGKTTITGDLDLSLAYGPNPGNYYYDIPLSTTQISWSAGDGAVSHNIYLGTDYNQVNNATDPMTLPGRGTKSVGNETYTVALVSGQKYYWRIDEYDGVSVHKGRIWEFTVKKVELASNPSPANGSEVELPITMTWEPGLYAVNHDVYIGTSFSDVNNAGTSSAGIYKGNVAVNQYSPTGLSMNQTYYWRIDSNAPGNKYKGSIWSFTTASSIVLDNFEGYSSTPIGNNWYGGSVNGTWGMISLWTSAPVEDGTGAKVTYYNSYAPYYSEVTYNLPSTKRNWVTGGGKILSLDFKGVINNGREQMYLIVADTVKSKTILLEDANDIVQESRENWRNWVIDLDDIDAAGVNLTDVRTLTIGFGNKTTPHLGGNGTVYVDNIKLLSAMCLDRDDDADLNNDCSVNLSDIEILAGDWLKQGYNVTAATVGSGLVLWYKFDEGGGNDVYDSSNNYDGYTELSWAGTTGYDGNGAIYFDGEIAIVVPLSAASESLGGNSTISFWLKNAAYSGTATGVADITLFQIGDGNGKIQVDTGWSGYFTYVCGWNSGYQSNDSVSWGDWGYTNHGHVQGQWNHYAFVKKAADGLIQIYRNGKIVAQKEDATGQNMYDALNSSTDFFTIGAWRWSGGVGGYYIGSMDDFRLYNRALSQAEILTLANVASLHQPVLSSANVSSDDIVNLIDFAKVADKWLVENSIWP